MNLKEELSKDFLIFLIIAALTVFIFSYFLFEFTGIRVIFAILIMWVPFYLMLSNFELALGEKAVFSLLFGLTIFPSIVYLLGLIISFKLSIIVTFLLLILITFIIRKINKK